MGTKKIRGLSLQLITSSELAKMNTAERIKKILNLVIGNRIVIVQGRLEAEEEARLIEDTMAMVDHVKSFKGIELAVIEQDLKDAGFLFKLKQGIARTITGQSNALSVIGPASIIKEIKRDPRKIELMLK
ncbi:MAG: DUF2073 domain-containing protein [Candidatus Pacearchaeota archaeon]